MSRQCLLKYTITEKIYYTSGRPLTTEGCDFSQEPTTMSCVFALHLTLVYIFPAAVPAIQGGCIHLTHAHTLAPRTTTDRQETPRPKPK